MSFDVVIEDDFLIKKEILNRCMQSYKKMRGIIKYKTSKIEKKGVYIIETYLETGSFDKQKLYEFHDSYFSLYNQPIYEGRSFKSLERSSVLRNILDGLYKSIELMTECIAGDALWSGGHDKYGEFVGTPIGSLKSIENKIKSQFRFVIESEHVYNN